MVQAVTSSQLLNKGNNSDAFHLIIQSLLTRTSVKIEVVLLVNLITNSFFLNFNHLHSFVDLLKKRKETVK